MKYAPRLCTALLALCAAGPLQGQAGDPRTDTHADTLPASTAAGVKQSDPRRSTPLDIAGIIVTAPQAERPTASHYELSPVGIARVPPLAEPDLFRAIATLPGIDQPNGWRSAFHVRGGASDETLIVLDGIPLVEPSHMLGLFGGVQLGVVGGATAHLGAPPVHFGDRLSGVIDIQTVVPDSAFYHGHLSLLSGGGVAGREWQRGGRTGSLLVAGRYASTELIGAALDAGRYGFADANLRFRQALTAGWTLDASGFLNGDWISDAYGDAADGEYRPDYNWGNRAGRVGLLYAGGSGWRARTDFLFSDYRIHFRDVPRGDGEAVEVIRAGTGLAKLGTRVDAPLGLDHRIVVGADLERESFEHVWRGAFEEFSPNIPPSYQYTDTQRRLSAYVADTWHPADPVELYLGLRALYLVDAAAPGPHLAPRVAARWRIAPTLESFASVGRVYQATTQAEEGREGDVAVPRFALAERPNAADVADLGAEWSVSRSMSLRLTGFAKAYRRIAQLDSASVLLYPSVSYPSFRSGTGRSSGAEVLFTRSGTRFDAQLAYTFTHTRVQFGEAEVPPDWDAPHAAKGLASLAIGRGWRTTVAGTLRSGLPYTPVLGAVLLPDGPGAGRRMRRDYIRGETNSRRLPRAERWDVGLEKQGQLRSGTYTFRLQALNVLNQGTMLRLNPAPYYDYGVQQGYVLDDSFDRSVPFLPSLGFEVHF